MSVAAGLAAIPLGLVPGPWAAPAAAGVVFQNCVTAADGSLTCDTAPTGNTLMNDVDARFGLLNNASPGWNEFDPYGAYNDEFGDNEG